MDTTNEQTTAPEIAPVTTKVIHKQNGVKRPESGTLTGALWDIADQLSEQMKTPAPRKAVVDAYLASVPSANVATANTQYARWVRYHNVSGILAEAREAAKADRAEASAAAKAEKVALREAEKAAKAEAKAAEKAAKEEAKAAEKAAKEAEKLAAKQAKEQERAAKAAEAEAAKKAAEEAKAAQAAPA